MSRDVIASLYRFADEADAFAKHHRALSVRKNSSPAEAAKDALVGSLTELQDSTSNFGLAAKMNTSPD